MSSTSLYGNVGNVTVSSKNLTTLYNATPGNTVVANVPDRNFTTLYAAAGQTDIKPTRAYGNANVEAFLNAGTDGSNTVQNITMSGTLNVGGQSQLGPVGNVHIEGGTYNYVLSTDGNGGLFWKEQDGFIGNIVPYIHFDVTSSGNNQQFTDANIGYYPANTQMNVMKNGVNIEPEFYQKVGNTTIQIDIPLDAGDDIDILAMGSGSEPAGNLFEVQFNGGGVFAANSSFTFDQANATLEVTNLVVPGTTTLSDVGNITITGGSNGQVLTTYGNGTLHWTTASGGGNGVPGGNTTEIQFNNAGLFDGSANLRLDLANNQFVVGTQMSVGNVAVFDEDVSFNKTGGNIYVNNFAYFRGEGVGFYPTNGWFVDMSTGSGNADFVGNVRFNDAVSAGTYTVNLGNVAEVKISGGTSGQVLTTDGANNLSWTSTSGAPGGPNTAIQFNNSGAFAGASDLTFDNANGILISTTSNIGNLNSTSNLTVTGNLIVQRAFEPVTSSGTGATGTINYDVLNQSIYYITANATANCTLNFRGNSSTTLNSVLPTNDSMTVVFLNTVGATAYIVTNITIDGNVPTINYVNGNNPTVGTRLTNAKQSYTYSIIKTAANTYTVLASLVEYQ